MSPSPRLVEHAATELEQLRKTGSARHFPAACRRLLRSLPGNTQCADCSAPNPDWASVSYGSLYCLVCSGRHRSYGVQTSVVRSVDLDAWTHKQVLAVLEGGNGQLEGFLDRHCLGRSSAKASTRYHTKAGRFYKTNLSRHVEMVAESGMYRGREESRRLHTQSSSSAAAAASSSSSNQPTKVATRSSNAGSSGPSLQPITVQ